MIARHPLARGWRLAFLTWAASFGAGGLVLGLLCWRHGRRRSAMATWSVTAVLCVGFLLALWHMEWPWQRWAWVFLAINGMAGIMYAFAANRLPSPSRPAPDWSLWSPQVFFGASMGFILGPAIGATAVLVSAVLLDPWFSTQVPVNAGLITLGIELIAAIVSLGFVGPVLGVCFARRYPEPSTTLVIRLCLSALAVSVIFLICQTLLFGTLSFQSVGMTHADILHVGKRLLLWCLFLVGVIPSTLWMAQRTSVLGAFRRLTICVAVVFLLHATWVIYLGLEGYGYLIGGRWAEQRGAVPVALQLYEKGLVARSTPMINSYLQYRVGLLSHRLGHHEQAMRAFGRVVTIYNANRKLVEEATDYQQNLKMQPAKSSRRVVKGVEAQMGTEYKSAYCAPNSLALVLGHWGYRVSPKQIGEAITAFHLGSSLVDIVWYTEQFPLRHRLVPFASIETIKGYVDRGIPVLAYLPGHVLAVFGYDEWLQTLVAYDTASWDIWVDLPIRRFEEEWKKTHRLLGIVEPAIRGEDVLRPPRVGPASQAQHLALLHDLLAREESLVNPRQARRHWEASLALEPSWFPGAIALYHDSPWTRSELGRRYPVDQLLNHVESSIPEYAYRGSPDLIQALQLAVRLGYYEDVKQFEERLRALGLLTPEFLGSIGLAALSQGKAQAGAALLGQATPPQPLELAVALERSGATEAALARYGEAVRSEWLQPTDRWLAMRKVLELGQRFKTWDRIVEAGQAYLEQHPYDAVVQAGYARSLLKMAESNPHQAEKLRARARKALANAEQLLLLTDPRLTQELRSLRENLGTQE